MTKPSPWPFLVALLAAASWAALIDWAASKRIEAEVQEAYQRGYTEGSEGVPMPKAYFGSTLIDIEQCGSRVVSLVLMESDNGNPGAAIVPWNTPHTMEMKAMRDIAKLKSAYRNIQVLCDRI